MERELPGIRNDIIALLIIAQARGPTGQMKGIQPWVSQG